MAGSISRRGRSAALVAALVAMHATAPALAREPSGVPLDQLRTRHPDDPAVVHAAAEKLLLRTRTDPDPRVVSRTEPLIEQALRLAPEAPRTWTLKAWSELAGHRFADALVSARAASFAVLGAGVGWLVARVGSL